MWRAGGVSPLVVFSRFFSGDNTNGSPLVSIILHLFLIRQLEFGRP